MKKVLLSVLICAVFQIGKAQNIIPTLKNNTELHYSCKLHGQTRALSLKTDLTNDALTFKLETRGVKSSIVTTKEGLKNGNALSYSQGEYAPILNLKPSETFFMISQSAYQNLIQNKKFVYNNTTYDLVENDSKAAVILDGKAVETFHIKAQIDETEMWIVKNPEFPLICKVTKNPLGINWTLVKIVP
ncbi:hypothetical protein ACWA1F_13510 [Flavobacterium sp. 3-218]